MWLLQSQMTCVAWKSEFAQLAHFTVSHNICQRQGAFYINVMWVIYFFAQTFGDGGGWRGREGGEEEEEEGQVLWELDSAKHCWHLVACMGMPLH